jgi:hypothetical protein
MQKQHGTSEAEFRFAGHVQVKNVRDLFPLLQTAVHR